MAIQITREEYERKFGVSPYAEVESGDYPDSSIPSQPSLTQEPKRKPLVRKVAEFAGLGGAIEAGRNIQQGAFLRFTPEGKRLVKDVSTGQATTQDVESIIGEVKPTRKILKGLAGSTIQAGALAASGGLAVPKTLIGRVGQYSKLGATVGLGRGIEEDRDIGQVAKGTILSGVLTGAFPVATTGIARGVGKVGIKRENVGEVIASILGNTIGKPPEVIKKAFQDPYRVATAITKGTTPTEVRQQTIGDLQLLKRQSSKEFESASTETQRLHPFKRTGQLLIQRELGNYKEAAMRLLRQFRVSVSKNGELDFDKLPSPIISGGERRNVQLTVNTIFNQSKFRPQDFQDTAARLAQLTHYSEGANTQASAIINQLAHKYGESITKVYPSLAKARQKYATEQAMYSELDNILRTKSLKPITVVSAVRRLSNIYKEDNELYLQTLARLEQKTGRDYLLDLAASEFAKVAPSSFGSRIAQAGLLAGGVFVNPAIVLAMPLFSPRLIGRLSTGTGKLSTQAKRIPGQRIIRTVVPQISETIGQ